MDRGLVAPIVAAPTRQHDAPVRIQRRALARHMREAGVLAWIAGAWLPAPDACFALGTVLVLASLLTQIARAKPGSLQIDGDRLVLTRAGRRRSFSSRDLTGAWIEGGDPVLALPGGDLVRLVVQSNARAAAILEDAGAAPGRLAAQFPLVRPGRAYAAFLVGLVLQIPVALLVLDLARRAGLSEEPRMSLAFSTGLAALFLMVRWMSASVLVVASDGVCDGDSFPRFLPARTLRAVKVVRGTATFQVATGTPVLAITASGWTSAQAIADRFEAARREGILVFDEAMTGLSTVPALDDPGLSLDPRIYSGHALLATANPAATERVRLVLRASASPSLQRLLGPDRPRALPARRFLSPDGLVLTGPRGGRGVVPYRAVSAFETEGSVAVLSVHGRQGRVRVNLGGLDPADKQRILAALAAVTSGTTPPPHARLERAGNDLAGWRAMVETLLRHDEGYREISVSIADARAALVAARSSAEQRLGAVLGLVAAGTEADRAEVVAVAARCAEPALARAMAAASRGALDEALVQAAIAAERLDDAAWVALEKAGVTVPTADGERPPG